MKKIGYIDGDQFTGKNQIVIPLLLTEATDKTYIGLGTTLPTEWSNFFEQANKKKQRVSLIRARGKPGKEATDKLLAMLMVKDALTNQDLEEMVIVSNDGDFSDILLELNALLDSHYEQDKQDKQEDKKPLSLWQRAVNAITNNKKKITKKATRIKCKVCIKVGSTLGANVLAANKLANMNMPYIEVEVVRYKEPVQQVQQLTKSAKRPANSKKANKSILDKKKENIAHSPHKRDRT